MRVLEILYGVCCFSVLLASATACAQEVEAFVSPTGFFLVEPDLNSGAVVAYGPTRSDANWAIAQWNIPGSSAPAFTKTSTAFSKTAVYRSQNANIDVQVMERDGKAVNVGLSHGGAGVPCYPHVASEYDLFATPNTRYFAESFPSARVSDSDPFFSTDLAFMSSLTLHASAKITNIWRTASLACGVNQRLMTLAVVLNNYGGDTRPLQTLFYEISLYWSRCGVVGEAAGSNCDKQQAPVRYFYFDGIGANATYDPSGKLLHQTFGYRDDVHETYGQPVMVPLQAQSYVIDLLSPLAAVIASGLNGMDHDLSHWHLAGVYYGSQIWGNVGISSEWTNFGVTVKE